MTSVAVNLPCPNIQHQQRLSLASTTSSESSAKQRKSHVGPWRLGRTLGRGSSGRVRLAKHCTTEQLAAIKIVPKEEVNNDSNSTIDQHHHNHHNNASGLPYGIEREVIIMKLIEHPNVMALYDVWENRGELYLVLEYVEGGELFDYLIKRGRLDEREAVGYFTQIIQGVEYCHSFGICHRDLKPENLLLDRHRNIKIADFGMAALETQGRMLETSCGSPHYASPEIVAGKCYHGAQADIWSCGIILFALLSGHLPFDDDNIRRLLWKVQAGKYDMPRHLSPEAKDLISRMLRVNPQDRISMREILRHPLVRKYQRNGSKRSSTHRKINSAFANVEQPVRSRSQIDMEIVKNLQTLWHGESKEKIISQLLAKEHNSEKVFYCLLLKYRQNHFHSQNTAQYDARGGGTGDRVTSQYGGSRSSSTITAVSAHTYTSMVRRSSRSSLSSLKGAGTTNASFRVRKKRSVSFERPRPVSTNAHHQTQGSTAAVAVASPLAQVSSARSRPPTIAYAESIYTATTSVSTARTDSVYSTQAVRDSIYSDKRASIELASICEAAFGTLGSPSPNVGTNVNEIAAISRCSSPAYRAVSDPTPVSIPMVRGDNYGAAYAGNYNGNILSNTSRRQSRIASDPTYDHGIGANTSLVPPAPSLSRNQSPAPDEPRTPATVATEFQLPMIFEEPDVDRFTDAIEEFQLPLASDTVAKHKKDNSKLHINLIGDSFRRSLCYPPSTLSPDERPVSQFDFETPTLPQENRFQTHRRSSVIRVPVPVSSPVSSSPVLPVLSPKPLLSSPSPNPAVEGKAPSPSAMSSQERVLSMNAAKKPTIVRGGIPTAASHMTGTSLLTPTYTLQSHAAKANELMRARSPPSAGSENTNSMSNDVHRSPNVGTPSAVQRIAKSPKVEGKEIIKPSSTPASSSFSPGRVFANSHGSAPYPTNTAHITSTNSPQTQQQVPCKSFTVANTNHSPTSTAGPKVDSKPSLLRKFTRYTPQRSAPAAPKVAPSPQVVAMTQPTPGEPKQNWFFKLLNHQFSGNSSSCSSPAVASTSHRRSGSGSNASLTKQSHRHSQVSKTLFCSRPPREACRAMLQVLNSWKKFGISDIKYKSESFVIAANILSTNVLSLRHAQFEVQAVAYKKKGSKLQFSGTKGSKATLSKFLGQFEKTLAEMQLLGLPSTPLHQ